MGLPAYVGNRIYPKNAKEGGTYALNRIGKAQKAKLPYRGGKLSPQKQKMGLPANAGSPKGRKLSKFVKSAWV